jgi:pimeloyl-ACP methyl ester carboxylesterase
MKLLSLIFLFGGAVVAGGNSIEETKVAFPKQVHQVIPTQFGQTHFEEVGDFSNPPVLLIHGVSGPMHVWDRNVRVLVSAGFRVIRLDLYGRGLSTRVPDGTYDLSMYVSQVEEVLKSVGTPKSLSIIGSSFGAVVASEFALQHPGLVNGVILVGPAGFPIQVPTIAKLRDVPLIGEIVFKMFGKKTILEQNRKYFRDLNPPEDFWSYFNAQLEIPGTTEAIRSTMRNAPVQNYISSYALLGKLNLPVAVVWGKQDVTFPYENFHVLVKQITNAKLVTVENSAHLPQYEKADEVNPAFIKFLRQFQAKRPGLMKK